MGRRKKPGFAKMKMLASRIEDSDYLKFDYQMKIRDGKKSLQDLMNVFVASYISGTIRCDGDKFVIGDPQKDDFHV